MLYSLYPYLAFLMNLEMLCDLRVECLSPSTNDPDTLWIVCSLFTKQHIWHYLVNRQPRPLRSYMRSFASLVQKFHPKLWGLLSWIGDSSFPICPISCQKRWFRFCTWQVPKEQPTRINFGWCKRRARLRFLRRDWWCIFKSVTAGKNRGWVVASASARCFSLSWGSLGVGSSSRWGEGIE